MQVTLGNTGGKFEVFGSDNTQKLFLNDSGNLGIGTITPGAKFDVNGGIKVGYDSGVCNS